MNEDIENGRCAGSFGQIKKVGQGRVHRPARKGILRTNSLGGQSVHELKDCLISILRSLRRRACDQDGSGQNLLWGFLADRQSQSLSCGQSSGERNLCRRLFRRIRARIFCSQICPVLDGGVIVPFIYGDSTKEIERLCLLLVGAATNCYSDELSFGVFVKFVGVQQFPFVKRLAKRQAAIEGCGNSDNEHPIHRKSCLPSSIETEDALSCGLTRFNGGRRLRAFDSNRPPVSLAHSPPRSRPYELRYQQACRPQSRRLCTCTDQSQLSPDTAKPRQSHERNDRREFRGRREPVA